MSPFRLELAVMVRSKGTWLALILGIAVPALCLLSLVVLRVWGPESVWVVRIALPTALVVGAVAQALLMPLLLIYLLGDSLAGQIGDRRLRSLFLTPSSFRSLYLGKLGAAFTFAVLVVLIGVGLQVATHLVATTNSQHAAVLAQGSWLVVPLQVGVFLAAHLALVAYLGLLFSLVSSFKAGLLATSAATAVLVMIQLVAHRVTQLDLEWLGRAMFSFHYLEAYGLKRLVATSTGRIASEMETPTLMAFLGFDVLLFAVLGYLAFRRRAV